MTIDFAIKTTLKVYNFISLKGTYLQFWHYRDFLLFDLILAFISKANSASIYLDITKGDFAPVTRTSRITQVRQPNHSIGVQMYEVKIRTL